MAETVEMRLRQIEERLKALEVRTGLTKATPPPVPTPPPLPRTRPAPPVPHLEPVPASARRARAPARLAPPTPAPTPTPRGAGKPSRDWERFFGMAVLGRVGVAAVLLAASYFAKLAYDTMGDLAKVASLYGLSAAFVALGFVLRPRVARRYTALLWGGGTAVAYLAGVAAQLRYGLVGPTGGLLLLVGASALGQALGRRLRNTTLAVVALGGAFAAPLLIAFPLSDRQFPLDPTALLVYVLGVYAWSAWTEQVWGWSRARLVGVLGTLAVVAVWIVEAGRLDATTYLHLNLYVLGLVGPELVAAWRRQALDGERIFAVLVGLGVSQGCLLLGAGALVQVLPALRWTFVLVGGAWMAIAIALALRGSRTENAALAPGLAGIGGILLVLGIVHLSPAILGSGTTAQLLWTVAALTAATGGLFLLRRLVGTADPAASLALGLAAFVALAGAPVGVTLGAAAIALLACVQGVVWGRETVTRGLAFWCGAGCLYVALLEASAWASWWQAVAIVGVALWSAAALAWDRRTGPTSLHTQGVLALWLAGISWGLLAFASGLAATDTPLGNPVTGAAVVLAAAATWSLLRFRRPEAMRVDWIRPALGTLALAVLLLAGQRETAEATKGLDPAIRAALFVLYLAASGVAVALLGERRRIRPLVLTGMALALTAAVRALATWDAPALGAWAMLELLAPLGAVLGVVHLARRGDRWIDALAAVGVPLVALGWGIYSLNGRLPHAWLLLNVRFVTGLALLGGLALLPARIRRGRGEPWVGAGLLSTGVLLGYCVGLAELLDVIARSANALPGAWPAVLVSVYTTLWCAGVLVAGFLRSDARLRYAALVGFGVVICKVGFFDLQAASLPLRILVTGLLGLVLLAAAFAYARRQADAPAASLEARRVP